MPKDNEVISCAKRKNIDVTQIIIFPSRLSQLKQDTLKYFKNLKIKVVLIWEVMMSVD